MCMQPGKDTIDLFPPVTTAGVAAAFVSVHALKLNSYNETIVTVKLHIA